MIDGNYFLGLPKLYKNDIFIYPPKIKDVVNNINFNRCLKILTLSQEEIEDELLEKLGNENIPTPFEFLLINCYSNEQYRSIAQESFNMFLHRNPLFLYNEKAICLSTKEEIANMKDINDLTLLKEEDYFNLQNMIREANGLDIIEPPNPNENERVREMKALIRQRDKVKNQKNSTTKLSTILCALCCMGIGLNPLNIGEISYPAAISLVNMLQQKEKYDIDIRSILAGADAKKIKPKYWIND